jgi:primosomal protein N'
MGLTAILGRKLFPSFVMSKACGNISKCSLCSTNCSMYLQLTDVEDEIGKLDCIACHVCTANCPVVKKKELEKV